MPKTLLLDCWLCVACYYPTTPTDYPSTTRGRSVSPPAAVNIDICGCLRFLGITFAWIKCVKYATHNFWSIKSFRFIGQCWYFKQQFTPERAITKASSVTTVLVSWEKCTFTKSLRLQVCRCLWSGLGGGGGTFWLLNSSVLQHSKPQQFTKQEWTKCLQNSTHFDVFISRSALKGTKFKICFSKSLSSLSILILRDSGAWISRSGSYQNRSCADNRYCFYKPFSHLSRTVS